MKDIFICHASEDKNQVVHPLINELKKANITYWVDEAEIHWGDSITEKVNEGLLKSNYVIVVLSKSFLEKNWPKRELNAVLNIEASSGEVKVLPLIHGNSSVILQQLPLLNDKMCLSWENGVGEVIHQLKKKLGITKQASTNSNSGNLFSPQLQVKIPKIRNSITQRDKDIYITQTFNLIKEYFIEAGKQTNSHYPEIQFDIEEATSRKFIAKIYNNGNIVNSCNIRIGGLHSETSIGYSEGLFLGSSDNSFNEIISIQEENDQLALGFMMGDYMSYDNRDQHYTKEKAAEELWVRFSSPLERS